MKVLFCVNLPSPYRVDFFNEYGKLCDLEVCYERSKSSERDSKWKATKPRFFTEKQLELRPIGVDKSIGTALRKHISRSNADFIIFSNYISPACVEAILYCSIKNIPYCLEYDGGAYKSDNFIKRIIKKVLLGNAIAHFTTGKKHKRYLKELGIAENSIYIYPFSSITENDIHNAKELSNYKNKQKAKESLGISEEKVIITVGRFTYLNGYGKGYDTLLKTAEIMKQNIGFYIIGGKPTEEFILWKEEKKLNNVHYIDFKEKDELREYYLAADLFVFMTRGDVWGLVINEAMMYGLPVISTEACGAALELIKEGKNGFIIPVNQPHELKDKINFLLSSDEVYDMFRRNSFKYIQEYSIEKMAEVHFSVLEGIKHSK